MIYAVGASADRRLSIPGEELPGSLSASAFVAWYNAHPDAAPDAVDLSAERVVVVGNGNVALDVARILLADPDTLARTDLADHALAALRGSKVREVVLLARRGPEHAAYTTSELLALKHVPGVELVVDDHDLAGPPRPSTRRTRTARPPPCAASRTAGRTGTSRRHPGGASCCASTAHPAKCSAKAAWRPYASPRTRGSGPCARAWCCARSATAAYR